MAGTLAFPESDSDEEWDMDLSALLENPGEPKSSTPSGRGQDLASEQNMTSAQQQCVVASIPASLPEPADLLWPPPADPVISNMLCICHLGIRLHTEQIARRLWNVEFNQRQKSLLLRSPRKRLCVAVYPSGKMTCVGARSETSARVELRRYARLIQKSIRFNELPGLSDKVDTSGVFIYHHARFLGFRVTNIKAEYSLGYAVDIRRVYESCRDEYHLNVFYDADIFPAIKLTLESPFKMTVQLFSTGAVGITGATSTDDINFVCTKMLHEICRKFAISDVPPDLRICNRATL
eukprot:RCo019279